MTDQISARYGEDSAVEPAIGRINDDHGMGRNHL